MKKSGITTRYLSSLFLATLYLLVALSPLAPVVLRGIDLSHAATGERADACCACSPEQRANHTCCCQRRREKPSERDAGADCCKKKAGGNVAVVGCGCRGDGKAIVLLNLPKIDSLPFVFDSGLNCALPSVEYRDLPCRMPTRAGEPPEPPPHLSFIS